MRTCLPRPGGRETVDPGQGGRHPAVDPWGGGLGTAVPPGHDPHLGVVATSSLGVHERSPRVSLTGVPPWGRGTDHVRCDLVRSVESVCGALGVGQAADSSHVKEVGTGTRGVLAAPASHHHLPLLVLLAGGGKADRPDGVSKPHGSDPDQSHVKLAGPSQEFSFSVTEEQTCLES